MYVWVSTHYRIAPTGKIVHVRGYWRRWPAKRRSATLIPFSHPSVA
jgi:hypothetical protein